VVLGEKAKVEEKRTCLSRTKEPKTSFGVLSEEELANLRTTKVLRCSLTEVDKFRGF
jgi:hypothetical protein